MLKPLTIAYGNALFRADNLGGGQIHVGKIIECLSDDGNKVWVWPGNDHKRAFRLPGRLARFPALASCDAILCRVDFGLPARACVRWGCFPWSALIGKVPIVFEFNQVPEYAAQLGATPEEVMAIRDLLSGYAKHVSASICVSPDIEKYVRELGFRNTSVIHNGSDSQIFSHTASPAYHVASTPSRLKICWLGSATSVTSRFDILMDVARRFWSNSHTRDDISIHVLGDVSNKFRNAPPNIRTHGAIPYEELPSWVVACDLGCLAYGSTSSGKFGSPLKLYDYMSAGLTPLSFPHPIVESLIEEAGLSGPCIVSEDAQSVFEALQTWIAAKGLIEGNRLRAHQLIAAKYQWRDTARKVADVIRGCL